MSRIVSILVFIALLAGAVMPRGYMTAFASDGSLTIRFCSAANGNQKQIAADDPEYRTYLLLYGEDAGHSDDDEGPASCDMGLPTFAPPPPLIVLMDTEQVKGEEAAISVPVLSGIFPSGLPPATGPPVT